MNKSTPKPSEIIESFLNYIDQCRTDYQNAVKAVEEADKKELIDLVHDMEFAKDKQERNRVATRLQRSRLDRRKNKDTVDELEDIVKFFDEINHKNTLNKLKQLLGKQRKTEEYLASERVYKPRKKGAEADGNNN
jgi:uncharacterized protein with von Willebrand factor type A (vWA) domain